MSINVVPETEHSSSLETLQAMILESAELEREINCFSNIVEHLNSEVSLKHTHTHTHTHAEFAAPPAHMDGTRMTHTHTHTHV